MIWLATCGSGVKICIKKIVLPVCCGAVPVSTLLGTVDLRNGSGTFLTSRTSTSDFVYLLPGLNNPLSFVLLPFYLYYE